MSAPRAFRIEHSHRPDCYAFEQACEEGGGPYHTLADGGDAVFCNRFANPKVRLGKHHLYIRVRCNDTKCPSTALVHLATALNAIGLNVPVSPDSSHPRGRA